MAAVDRLQRGMHGPFRRIAGVALFLLLSLWPIPGEGALLRASEVRLSILYGSAQKTLEFTASEPVQMYSGDGQIMLPPGAYRVQFDGLTSPRTQTHVFSKSFKPNETEAWLLYEEAWRAKGYQPELVTVGAQFETTRGQVDNRIQWVSLARCATQGEAESIKKRLETEKVFAWLRTENTNAGAGTALLISGTQKQQVALPLHLESAAPLSYRGLQLTAKGPFTEAMTVGGAVRLTPGRAGLVSVVGELPVERYLEMVLPAEMPALWPAEALKAQAICARSEILASYAARHSFEGYDFCALEHCRAFAPAKVHPATTAAVQATAGEILGMAGQAVPAVFSASCGGWTEANETVWAAPPQAALRPVPDLPKDVQPPRQLVAADWIQGRPRAWCAPDTDYFRWERRLTQAELDAAVNAHVSVGPVAAIELGDRGPGGRLEWVRVSGARSRETIKKEYPIRVAFGGLPSAMFTLQTAGSGAAKTYIFRGAGRGHGVGMCQQGARGMAASGLDCHAILAHYFAGTRIEKVK